MIAVLLSVSLVILRIPSLFQSPPSWAVYAPVALFGLGALVAANQHRRLRVTSRGEALLVLLIVFVTCVTLYRGGRESIVITAKSARSEILTLVTFTAFVAAAVLGPAGAKERTRVQFAFLLAPSILAATAIILHFAHFGYAPAGDTFSSSRSRSQLLALLGISAVRTGFPLTEGFNSFGIVAGSAVVSSLVLAIRGVGRQRLLALCAFAVGLYGVVASDSRGPLVFAFVTAVVALLSTPRLRRSLAVLPLLLPLVPLVLISLLKLIATTPLGFAISRSATDLSTANGRTAIWNLVLNFLGHGDTHLLYGYGAFGQATSAIGFSYAYLFPNLVPPESATTHNIMLQTLLDSGLIGLLLLLATFVMLLRRLARKVDLEKSPTAAALFALSLYVVSIGTLEASPSIYGEAQLAVFVGLAIFSVSLPALPEVQAQQRLATPRRALSAPRREPVLPARL